MQRSVEGELTRAGRPAAGIQTSRNASLQSFQAGQGLLRSCCTRWGLGKRSGSRLRFNAGKVARPWRGNRASPRVLPTACGLTELTQAEYLN